MKTTQSPIKPRLTLVCFEDLQTLARVLLCCCLLAVPQSGMAQTTLAGNENTVCDAIDSRYHSLPDKDSERDLNAHFLDATSQGCIELMRFFISRGASVNTRDRYANTPFLIAAHKGHNDAINLLVDQGSDLHLANRAGNNAVLRAVTKNHPKTVQRLLELGVDPNLPNSSGVTALTSSVYNGQLIITKALIEAGADPSILDASGKSPIVYAAGKGFLTLVKLMFASGKINVNTRYGNNLTLLMWAAGHGNDVPAADGLATVKYLHEKGAELNLVDNRGRSALMVAAERGHTQLVEWLLQNNADKTLRDAEGEDALTLAATEKIKALLSTQ